MSGSAITAYLRRLCHDMDAGRPLEPFPWRKALAPLAVPVVMGLSLGASSCEEEVGSEATPPYAVPMPDLVEQTPLHPEPAPVPAYMAPPPDLGDEEPSEAPSDGGPVSSAVPGDGGAPPGAGSASTPATRAPTSEGPPARRAVAPEMADLYGVPFE